MLKSFRDYLKVEYKKLPILIDFDRFDEMAQQRQVVRKPVNLDEDDINFLNQFDYSKWGDAIHQRYNLLFDEIDRLHKVKHARDFKVLIDGIKNFLKDRSKENVDFLKRIQEPFDMSQDEIEEIANRQPLSDIEELSDHEIEALAEKYAQDHFDNKNEDNVGIINDPDYHDFVFSGKTRIPVEGSPAQTIGSGRSAKITVQAKPYILRLYHKLERTEGEEHLRGSGLEGLKAKYGYELSHPVRGIGEDPHVTRGMTFPTLKQSREVAKRFMELNAHRMFGEYGPDVKWMDSGFEDSFTREEAIRKYKKIVKQSKGCPSTGSKLELGQSTDIDADLIEREAIKCLVADMKAGKKFNGPPYPPDHRDGLPLTIGVRTVKGERREDVFGPPLYLPFKKNEKDEWKPVVKPAYFYRRANVEDRVSKEARIGHNKEYIKMQDVDDPTGEEISKDAALNIHQNPTKRLRLIKATPEYKEAYKNIMQSQIRAEFTFDRSGEIVVMPNNNGKMFYRILLGVAKCINSKHCGGKTTHEMSIMKRNIPAIYDFAYKYVEDQFGSEKFFSKKTNQFLSVPQLHRAAEKLAHTATNLLSQKQQTVGGGTRRRRAKSEEMRKEREERPLFPTRIQYTGDYLNFSYDPENFGKYLTDLHNLEAEAREEESVANQIKSKRTDTIIGKNELGTLLRNTINKENAIVEDILQILIAAIRSVNRLSPEISRQNAESQIKEWEKELLTPAAMIDRMKDLPVIKKMMEESKSQIKTRGVANMPNIIVQREINDAKSELDNDLTSHDADSAFIKGKYGPAFPPPYGPQEQENQYGTYVRNMAQELQSDPSLTGDAAGFNYVLQQVQKYINQRLGIGEVQTPPKDLTPTPNANWVNLMNKEQNPQNLFDIVSDPNFAKNAMDNMTAKLKGRIDKIKNKFTQNDYEKMMKILDDTGKRAQSDEKLAGDYRIRFRPRTSTKDEDE
jgi:hypothetical protein